MTDDFNRNMDPVAPVDPMLTGEVFKVKPAEKDADRNRDERFEEQLKKKQKQGRAGAEDAGQQRSGPREAPKPRDEIILTNTVLHSSIAEGGASSTEKPVEKKPVENDENGDGEADRNEHVDVIA